MTEEKLLLVCLEGRAEETLTRLLQDASSPDITAVHSVGEARRRAGSEGYAMVVINAPLRDETGLEWAMELTQQGSAAVLLLVKNELMGMVYAPATEAGVMVIGKPIAPQAFGYAMQLARATHNRLRQMDRENEKLHKRLEELRVVDRAKCLLVQHMHITEEQAHRAIEKQAMDERTTRLTVAKAIMERFEL